MKRIDDLLQKALLKGEDQEDSPALLLAFIINKLKSYPRALMKKYPEWEEYDEQSYAHIKMSPEAAMEKVITMGQEELPKSHSRIQVEHLISQGNVRVLQTGIFYETKENMVGIDVEYGTLKFPQSAVVACNAVDQVAFLEVRNGKNVNPTLTSKNAPSVNMAVIEHSTLNVFDEKHRTSDVINQLYPSFNKNFVVMAQYMARIAVKMPPGLTTTWGNLVEGIPDQLGRLPAIKPYKPPTLATQPTLEKTVRILTAHEKVRGRCKKGNGMVCAGFYAFTSSESVARLMGLTADIMGICDMVQKTMVYFTQSTKDYNETLMSSLVLNGFKVATSDFGLSSQYARHSYDSSREKEYVRVSAHKFWSRPTLVAQKNQARMGEINDMCGFQEDLFQRFMESSGFAICHVYVSNILEKYVEHLYPSTRGHLGLVWLANKPFSVPLYQNMGQVYARCVNMAMCATHFPFSRYTYAQEDKHNNRWKIGFVVGKEVMKKTEVDIASMFSKSVELTVKPLSYDELDACFRAFKRVVPQSKIAPPMMDPARGFDPSTAIRRPKEEEKPPEQEQEDFTDDFVGFEDIDPTLLASRATSAFSMNALAVALKEEKAKGSSSESVSGKDPEKIVDLFGS